MVDGMSVSTEAFRVNYIFQYFPEIGTSDHHYFACI